MKAYYSAVVMAQGHLLGLQWAHTMEDIPDYNRVAIVWALLQGKHIGSAYFL